MANILVVEDDDQIRTLIKKMLEGEKTYSVTEAENGEKAIRLAKKTEFDLIITDIIMPEKEGIETIKEIREIYPMIKIIAISGGGRIGPYDYLDLAKRLGAKKVLEKPFDLKEMLVAVKELLNA